jgi:hypothetical protein
MAGAQVASRRKAQHGSSRTVSHEGSQLGPGDTNAPTVTKVRRPGWSYSSLTGVFAPGPLPARTASCGPENCLVTAG